MTRSILWISSNAPSSLLPMACVALPQPRSRMAFAADTFAVAVASFDRMTPTRTLSAVRVWLRASDRISVTVLAIFQIIHGRIEGRKIFTRCRVDVIHGQIVGPRRRVKRSRREMHRLSPAIEPWNEWNNFRAHDNASHTAIVIRAAKESDTR